MTAIISTAIRFSSDATVKAYMQIPVEDRPEKDLQVEGVTGFKLGYDKLVLTNADGSTAGIVNRHSVKGFAFNGTFIAVHGDSFRRMVVTTDEEGNLVTKFLDEPKVDEDFVPDDEVEVDEDEADEEDEDEEEAAE